MSRKTIEKLSLFLMACLLSFCNVEAQKKVATDYRFKGKVKSAISYSYIGTLENGVPTKDAATGERLFYFDKKGHKIKEVSYAPIGHLQYVYLFDTSGHIVRDTDFSSTYKKGYNINRNTYKRNEKGQVIEQLTVTNNSTDTGCERYIYDERGNHTKTDFFYIHGKSHSKAEFTYYTNNNLESSTDRSLDGKLSENQTYLAYDSNGNYHTMQSQLIGSDFNIKSTYKYEYKYDKVGNVISLITYHDGKIEAYTEIKIVYY